MDRTESTPLTRVAPVGAPRWGAQDSGASGLAESAESAAALLALRAEVAALENQLYQARLRALTAESELRVPRAALAVQAAAKQRAP